MVRATAQSACRDCAQPGFGGPFENRFTAFDAICRGDSCRDAGYPQIFVNTSNLTLFVRVTDLAFGGPSPGLVLERYFNMDDPHAGPFGPGWSFSLGETLTTDTDGSLQLRRGSGRTDRYVSVSGSGAGAFLPVTATSDALSRGADGAYTLRAPGSATVRRFSAEGRLLAIQDSGNTRITLDYDAAGRLTAAHYRGRLIQFSSDSGGRITSISDAAGRTVLYNYTADGRLRQQTSAAGQTVAYEYEGSGNLTSANYGGGKFSIAYASDGPFTWVAGVTAPDAFARRYDVPRAPTEIRVTDGNGDATLYVSNALGLLQSATDAAGNTLTYSYDAAGNRTRAVNAAGETTTFAYDSNGNLTGITDGAGNRWSADYQSSAPAAGPAHITDANGNVWTLKYDAGGMLSGVTNPAGGSVSATRSASGQITGVTDAKGNKTAYQYNGDGLLAAYIDALGGKWTYDYDGVARAVTRTDPGGGVLKADYTVHNQIGGLTAGDARTTFDFSGVMRNSLGQLVSYTDSFGNRLTYSYDGAGQVTGMTLPGGKAVTYQYDHLHRLSKVSDWLGNFALYRYDAAGWPASVSVSGGPVTIYQYDAARNLRAIVSTGPDGMPVAGYRYTVDAGGNRTAVSALEPFGGPFSQAAYTLGYDAANRPVTRSDGQAYRYDARGNLTEIQGPRGATLGYDAFGRLQIYNGEKSTLYGYDSTGLRAVRTTGGTERRLVHDFSGAWPRVIMEADASNTPVAWYVYGLGLLWKVTADGTPYFYHFDGDGNVVAVSNPAAGVVNQYRYDPSGRLAGFSEGVENMFRAHGEAGWTDDGNGFLFTGDAFQAPELRMTLPAVADPAPPVPALAPQLRGAGACFLEGVSNCRAGLGRRER